MTIFNSILHIVSEKKIFEISANQRLLWPLAAISDNRSEQKVTTIDQNLVRNIYQVLLLFGPIENPRWPPSGDIS
jgi:hypothetical protein